MILELTDQNATLVSNTNNDLTEGKVSTSEGNKNIEVVPDEKDEISPTRQIDPRLEDIETWIDSTQCRLQKHETKISTIQETNPREQGGFLTTFIDKVFNDNGTMEADRRSTEKGKECQIGDVQDKTLAGVKSFGSYLYCAINKAGRTVSEASAKIKETVEKSIILSEFQRVQEAFAKEKAAACTVTALPPWFGFTNEECLKQECLFLSNDKRNFIRSPPAGIDYQFEYDVSYPVAMAIMKEDVNLEKMRYDLVPKVISEQEFWRNYFYRVSLICQANELSIMTGVGDRQSNTGAAENLTEVKNDEGHEFISDTLRVNNEDLEEIQDSFKKLAWEQELEGHLQDYEVINENNLDSTKNETWEEDIEKILQEEADLA